MDATALDDLVAVLAAVYVAGLRERTSGQENSDGDARRKEQGAEPIVRTESENA